MEIRFARPEDIPAILQLLRQVGGLHHGLRPDIFRENAQKYSASQLISMLADPVKPIFIAAEGDTVLGYGFCQLRTVENNPVMKDRTELYVDDLCVEEAGRKQGVGKALYTAIRSYGKMRRCHSITLNVWSCNEGALAFYRTMGLLPRNIHLEDKLEC